MIPNGWTVERTYGWLMFSRRLTRDYEIPPARSEAVIQLAISDLMARRLTGEATISWHDQTSPGSNANSGMKRRKKTTSESPAGSAGDGS
ncbi:hypothetical protein S1361_37380 [Streptomyces cyanogenus]|uniref:Transposase n=1 Tax=Streptomyces cyanogenus TaxID=80860 RepID=A0ABX7U203_STRCY|nr:hypothetical protein S1361_37380 [Streptomyces cyanogenus]